MKELERQELFSKVLIQIFQPYHESDPDGEVEGPVEVDGCDEGPEEGAVLKLGMLEGDEDG
jgi:hypothetical protein